MFAFHQLLRAVDTSCNRSSDAQISLHNLVPITDSDASHIHCTLNCICKKDHDILYHGTMYHTPLNNTRFSIDASYNVLIASLVYLHQCFYILKILAHSVDFNWTLSQCYDSLSIFQFSEIDLSQLLYSFWRVGIIMSKLKNKLLH